MNPLPPLSLYLHFPWCVAKCPYCDFNSYSLSGALPGREYVSALIAELEQQPAALSERPLVSVFMGGGTPSMFPPEELQRLMDAVRKRFVLIDDCEVTLEANPGALEHSAFKGYRDAGINRLSLGAQSFSDTMLNSLGRVHNSADIFTAFAEARSAGFDNINLDLMYALPEQTLESACTDIDAAIELRPEHISYYHLTLEPNTVFFARPPAGLPDEDWAWEIQSAGRFSQHNLNYWNYGDYLGLGAGAHGKLTDPAGVVHREQRVAHPRTYLQHVNAGKQFTTSPVDEQNRVFEFMLNAMRLRNGVGERQFERYTGLPVSRLAPGLAQAAERELVEISPTGQIRPTPHGWRFLDDLQAVFLPPAGN